jgi:hypothetical protein
MSYLATEKSQPIVDPYQLVWMITGESGIGKTTFCSTIPDAYFLVTDARGTDCVSVYGGDRILGTWEAFKNAAREFLEGNHNFKALVIDDIESAWELCSQFLCEEKGKLTLNEVSSKGGGYKKCATIFQRVLFPIFASGYGIFMTCKERYDTYESTVTDQKDYKIWPDIIQTARRIAVGKSHQLGRIYMKKVMENGVMVDKRVISFEPNSLFETKDRSNFLAAAGDIILDSPESCWESIFSFFPKIEREEADATEEKKDADAETEIEPETDFKGDLTNGS